MFLRFLLALFMCMGILNAQELEFCPNLTDTVRMRDGFLLPIDIYLPKDWNGEKIPCILLRCPAGKKALPWVGYTSLTHYGYAVAMQDTRSALDVEGKTAPFLSDGWGKMQDGYDTVEWLAKQPFCNGKIGTLGFSAVGCTQLLLAPSAPPSLCCQYIGIGAPSLYHHAIFPGGQLLKNQVEGWLGAYSKDTGILSYVSSQPFYNLFWEELDSIKVASKVNVPGFIYGGWYDTFLQGTIDAFTARQYEGGKGALGKQKLLIGPWTHWWPMSSKLGDFSVPQKGFAPDVDLSPERWFDKYLKEKDNGIDEVAPIIYYVMGPFDGSCSSGNVWKTAAKWPVPSKKTEFYLGKANDIKMYTDRKSAIFTFTADPKNPVPTIGGRNLFLEAGPMDQTPIEKRKDVILFTSNVLDKDLEITGKMSVKLFISTDAVDSDFVVRLTDVYPDGRSILISDGLKRVMEKVTLPKEIEIDLAETSFVFAKGHRLRISLSGSNYPRYEINHHVNLQELNEGIWKVSTQRVYTGKRYPSRLILPIIE